MKNPFDDNPFDDNNPFDIFGNHPQDTDPNPHDGFQSHPPDFQNNSSYNPFDSGWGANHPDPSAFDPVQPASHDHPSLSEINARISELDPDYVDPSDPSEFDPVTPSELDARISEMNARISELDPDYVDPSDPSEFDPVQPVSHNSFHSREWGSGHHDPHGDFHPRDWGAEHHGHHEHHRHHEQQAHHSGIHHSGWTSPLSDDHHQHSHDANWMPQQDHHIFGSAANSSVRHFESSSDSSKHPYITVSDSSMGYVYLNGDKDIGRIDGYTIYNSRNLNCGHWTTDGKVYDYHDNLVGWVHPDGHVYAKGSSGDVEVYQTDKGVAGGAAYLLLVWCGGQTHA